MEFIRLSLEENIDYSIFAGTEDGQPPTAGLFLTARGLLTLCFTKTLSQVVKVAIFSSLTLGVVNTSVEL